MTYDKPTEELKTDVALICQNVQHIKSKVDKIEARMESHYVTKDEFDPIKRLVWLMMSLIMSGFFGSIIFLLWRKP